MDIYRIYSQYVKYVELMFSRLSDYDLLQNNIKKGPICLASCSFFI